MKTDKEIEAMAEKTYPEYPTEVAGSMHYNKDIHCFKKRKAFIKGFKQAQNTDELVQIFRNFIRANYLSKEWDEYIKVNNITLPPPPQTSK